jgi:RHS repeat-associated protein
VKSLLQDNPSLASLGQQCKQIDYEFDILSGKMNKVIYQPARPDQFIHNYDYDADNRITVVSTSKNNITWDRDARYFYYQHGPLARTEIGNDIVQGLDYVYTLQGWIKGVNSEILDPKNDVGADGYATGGYMANQPGIHKVIPPDVAGYSLRYFDGDYKPIKSFSPADYFLADRSQASYLAAAAPGLYNGNIASMVTTIDNFDPNSPVTGQPAPMLTAYRYDQLNRIMRQEAWQKADILIDNSWASAINDQSYANTFHYDGNGNILFLNRKGTTSPSFNGVNMDDLTYHYNWKPASPDVEPYFRKLENNQLNYITDAEIAENYPDDLHNQTSKTNYTYDEIGNLKSDASEQIREIQWTVYGKVKKIIRDANSEKEDLEFRYDAFGKRIAKIVKKHGYSVENGGSDNPDYWRTTWYIHDAQGNIMATYLNNGSSMTAPGFYLDEQHLYGSSRLGVVSVNRLVDSLPNSLLTRFSGSKQYELTNHLGNVLATVSDMKVPVDGKYQFARLNSSYKLTAYGYIAAPGFYGQTAPPDGLVDSYLANVRSGQDPYPFGMPEPGRVFSGAGYRFGFNGKENDKEVFGSEGTFQDYGMRMYDTRGCRFISVDPLTQKYPELTPFQFSTNNPIWNIDIDGLEGHETTKGKTKVEKCPEPKGHPIAIPIHLRIKIETPKLFKRVTTYEETPKFGLNRSKHAKDKDMHMRIALEETGDITVEWDLRELPDNIKVSLHGQSLGGSGGLAQYDKGSPVIIQEGSYSAGDLLSIDVFHGPTGGTQYDVKVYSSEMVMKRITKVYFLGIFLVKIERQKFNPDDFPKKIDYDRKVKWTKKL